MALWSYKPPFLTSSVASPETFPVFSSNSPHDRCLFTLSGAELGGKPPATVFRGDQATLQTTFNMFRRSWLSWSVPNRNMWRIQGFVGRGESNVTDPGDTVCSVPFFYRANYYHIWPVLCCYKNVKTSTEWEYFMRKCRQTKQLTVTILFYFIWLCCRHR